MPDFVAGRLDKSTHNVGHADTGLASNVRMPWSLFDVHGRRKYLVPVERRRFLQAALSVGGPTASLRTVLAFCGPRVSEVLALTPISIDDHNRTINFHTLKRRARVIRAVPVPRKLLDLLEAVHGYRAAQGDPARCGKRLWTFSRTTAWRRVRHVMEIAKNPTYVASPKALRHAFGAASTLNGVSLAMIQKWLGHADVRTTTIYSTVIGNEERVLARRQWKPLEGQLP